MTAQDAAARQGGLAGWLSRWLCRLSARATRRLATLLGWLWFHLFPVRRRVALDNLRRAFPELRRRERRRLGAACFRHLACCALEFLRMPRLLEGQAKGLFEVEGEENLKQARAAGRGIIAVTGHLGSFDLLACYAARRWFELHVVSREQKVGWINRYWMESRRRWGVKILPPRGSALTIHRLLRNGAVVALLIDQHQPHGLVCEFFGRPAACTTAPALLAYQTGALLLPVWSERLGPDKHRLHIAPAQEADRSRPRSEEVEKLTRQLNLWLEDCIRKRPEQWLWLHRRWKVETDFSPPTEKTAAKKGYYFCS